MIGRNAAFTYKGKHVDLKQIGRELNVRYVLEGSIQRGGNRMRVNVQLIDALSGNHLWAERFDVPLAADLFDMQDEIVARLAGALNAIARRRRSATGGTGLEPQLDRYPVSRFGVQHDKDLQTHDNIAQARGFFDRAVAADPAMSTRSFDPRARSSRGRSSFVTDPMAAFAAAEAKLTRALSSVPDHARGACVLGIIDMITKRAAEGIAECEHALAAGWKSRHAHAIIG